MPTFEPGALTRILNDLNEAKGDRELISSRLYEQVYGELHRIASRMMRRERPNHTLQSTALVNEVYIKLADESLSNWQGRAHFFGIAARAMRQILVDHARKHTAEKRGGDLQRVTLQDDVALTGGLDLDLMALETALEHLAEQDARMARVVEMRVFAGMISREVAHVIGVSKRTVDEDWKVAKLFLPRELSGNGAT